ncbi:photosystem II protein Y [Lusitaniella coriacea LEGE 07157]|uniref:Photosystem II reaction center protein Y n=1 Tax=Lusitaniella coriacea LEGE 07157 TaxID=945747 RepID=A0A8J7DT27_9CYAN|nr:photosystem II protein Y [Lusitaniella coriacea]MBE9115207.1 photosystem II protein Y [Lusitaniella coriacea LEGE 07157]
MVFLKLLLILLPLVIALVWVSRIIGKPALDQGKDFLNKP